MKKVSDKRRKQLALYSKLKAAYLAEHPYCEYEELGSYGLDDQKFEFPIPCFKKSTQIHHKKGREGGMLNEAKYFLAVCDFHGGSYIHDRSGDSYDRGFMLNRWNRKF